MNAQRQDHGGRLRAIVGNLVASTNFHQRLLQPPPSGFAGRLLRIKTARKFLPSRGGRGRAATIVARSLYRPATAAVTLTATFMLRWSDAVPNHVPCNGIASR